MKALIKNTLDFFSYSNFFIGICGFLFSWQANVLIHDSTALSAREFLYSVLFTLSVVFVYGFQRVVLLVKLSKTHPENETISSRELWLIRNLKFMVSLLSVSASGIIFLVFFIDWKLILYFLPLLLVSVLYFAGPIPLKKIAGLKSFLISFVWTGAAYIVPVLLFHERKIDSAFFLYIMGQFFFLAALCTPFDIRDYERDKSGQIKSLPVLFGVNAAKTIGVLMVLLYFVFNLFNGFYSRPFILCATILSALYAIVVIIFSNKKGNHYFSSFFADGGIILQVVFLFLCFKLFLAFGVMNF